MFWVHKDIFVVVCAFKMGVGFVRSLVRSHNSGSKLSLLNLDYEFSIIRFSI